MNKKVFIGVILLIVVAMSAVFSACNDDVDVVTSEQEHGINVQLWEGNSYTLDFQDVSTIYDSLPEREGYVFAGWYYDKDTCLQPVSAEDLINAEVGTTIYAKWIDLEDSVLVTFYGWSDDMVLLKAYFPKGSDLSDVMISAGNKPSSEQYDYEFAGWDKILSEVNEDTEVRPLYNQKLRSFSVQFSIDGVIIDTQTVNYGESAVAPSEQTIQNALPQVKGYTYKFAGWDSDFSSITEDTIVNADLTIEAKTFTVTFNYGDGKSETQTVKYGEDAVLPDNSDGKLNKQPQENIDYLFVGWDNNAYYVTEDRVINAIYQNNVKYYTVDFYDGDVLFCRRYVEYGKDAVIPETQPVKAGDNKYDYVFAGWQGVTTNIQKDEKVYAVYDSVDATYTVDFYADGKLIASKTAVGYGSAVEAPVYNPVSDDIFIRTFAGWDKDITNITGDTKVNAIINVEKREFEVTFMVGGVEGYRPYVVSVPYGEGAIAPEVDYTEYCDEKYYYEFAGWDKNFSSVKEDMTVHSLYNKHARTYEIVFEDYQGNDISVQFVKYGESAVAPQSTSKPSTVSHDYVFAGWDSNAYQNITGNAVIKPVFEEVLRSYTVVFTYLDSNCEWQTSESVLQYGSEIQAPVSLESYSDEMYNYVFAGWSNSVPQTVEGNLDTKAVYEKSIKTFSVQFNYGDGQQSVQDVEYGQSAVAPENVEKSPTTTTKYIFAGWDREFSCVTENIVVNAIYNEIDNCFSVTFYGENKELLIAPQYVRYGKDTAVQPDNSLLKKASTVQYDYTFDGWTYLDEQGEQVFITAQEFEQMSSKIDKDYAFTIHFTQTVRQYAVVFSDEDGSELKATMADYGTAISEIKPENPQKASTQQFDYIFDCWYIGNYRVDNIAEMTVEGNIDFKASYIQTLREYSVIFNYGDNKTSEQNVKYGQSAVAPTDVEKTATATTKYIFAGWDTEFASIVDNTVVTALYNEIDNYFKVSFYDETGTILLSAPQYVRYGKDTAVQPDSSTIVKASTAQYDYTFDGWLYKDEQNPDGVVISVEQFEQMKNQIDRDYTFTAHFAQTVRQYWITFRDDDGSELKKLQADYGLAISEIEPPTPTKDMTAQYIYTFDCWIMGDQRVEDTSALTINGDMVFTATYTKELRPYTVTFLFGDGDSEVQTVLYGYNADPSSISEERLAKTSSAKYDYTFIGWDRPMVIYEDTTINALYSGKIRSYTVKFYNMSTGLLEGENLLPYGSWIDRTMSQDGYDWDSWYFKTDSGYTALPLKEEVTATDEDGQLIGHVQGDMELYGNLVMSGFTFDSNNNISWYGGSADFVILPTYANRAKVNEVGSQIFKDRTQEEITAVYVPDGLTINAKAFRSTDKIYTIFDEKDDVAHTLSVYFTCDRPTGGTVAAVGRFKLNWASELDSNNVFWNVSAVTAIGDYQVIMYEGSKAILHRYINAAKGTVEIPTTVSYKGVADTEAKTYTVTGISSYAYAGMENVQNVFVPKEAENMKFGAYMFSNLNVNVYVSFEKPTLGYVFGKWNRNWDKNADSGIFENSDNIKVEWNCDGVATVDNVTYILRGTGEATAISQDIDLGQSLVDGGFVIAGTVEYGGKTYTVTELGSQLFKGEALMTKVSIPSTIKVIGNEAFYGTGLSTLVLPEGLEEIGNMAFALNLGLKAVYVPASCDTIGYFAFTGANNCSLYMGRDSAPFGSGGLVGNVYKLGWNYTVTLDGLDLSNLGLETITQLIENGTELPTYWSQTGIPQ